jgi:hypothetical protein
MPADGSIRCPFASNGDVGTSRLEQQLSGRLSDFTTVRKTAYWSDAATKRRGQPGSLPPARLRGLPGVRPPFGPALPARSTAFLMASTLPPEVCSCRVCHCRCAVLARCQSPVRAHRALLRLFFSKRGSEL